MSIYHIWVLAITANRANDVPLADVMSIYHIWVLAITGRMITAPKGAAQLKRVIDDVRTASWPAHTIVAVAAQLKRVIDDVRRGAG